MESVRAEIESAQRILVVSHVRPDGDAVGSLLGMGLALEACGKEVQMVLSDGVPLNFHHLPAAERVRKYPEGSFDFTVVVDCSDLKRAATALDGYGQPDLNIDHHITNTAFARFNLVDDQAVATAEILATNLPVLGLPITNEVGAALLTGLITDTLGFRTRSTTSHALRLAADLMDMGINMPDLYFRAMVQRSYEAVRYWGRGLSRVQREGRIVWTALTLEDRRTVGYPGRDDADLINVLTSVREADVAIIFVEQEPQRVKISWRARNGLDTTHVARQFGGGGHPAASGAMVEGALEQVQRQVIQATHKFILDHS